MRRYLLLRYYKISWFCNVYIILLTRLEKLINYLYLIQKIWSEIADNNLTIIKLIDKVTVKLLKLQVLENSDKDAQLVQKQMHQKLIFDTILDLLLRRRLLTNLLTLDRLILLLHTFCENTKYLELCVNTIKRLLKPDLKDIVQDTIRAIFNQLLQQNKNNLFEQNYRQL